jgi:hypothetical protein
MWQGLDFQTWLRLLSRGPQLHVRHAFRLAAVTAGSMANSVLGLAERMTYGRRLRDLPLPQAPVFILGHWRSGTTLLHNLLANDPQFTYANLYHVLNPHHFLLTESLVTRLTSWLVPKMRPMDNMAVSWNAPQEDETGLALLTLMSPYMMLAYQGQRPKYERYFDFQQLSEGELDFWRSNFLTFLKKLTLREPKTLLLKSPPHTYRIPILLEMFPDAKFIHIVRNPYAVYSSSMHLRKKLFEGNTLGKPNFEGLEEDMFVTYEHCFRAFETDRRLLAPHQLHELRFEELEQDPLGELRKVYQKLGLEGYDALHDQISPQLDSLRKYRKNEFKMEEALKRRIFERCQEVFRRYQYPSGLSSSQPAQVA